VVIMEKLLQLSGQFLATNTTNSSSSFLLMDLNFEITNRTVLGCLVFKLQSADRQQRIFLISVIHTNTMHFIHYCNGNECINGHNLENEMYIRNFYFFKDV
jgi:hypothetical protein